MKSVFPIKFKIKGIVLDASDLCVISEYYEAACTAEYIYDNYKVSESDAMELGYKVRRLMSKYEYTEEEAIYEAFKTFKCKRRRTP